MHSFDSKDEKSPAFSGFADFYPYYLTEHSHPTSRRLHFLGTGLVILITLYILVSGRWYLIPLLPVAGYGFAWIGHFVFEKNKPATFKHPLYSLMGDFVMFRDILIGKIKL